MTITILFYERKENFEPDYNKRNTRKFYGANATECMAQVRDFRYNHDLAKYTPTNIINVED